MPDQQDLQDELQRIDGRGYRAYRGIRGAYSFPDFSLHIDHVQADPFAAPSRLRLRVPQERARYPAASYANPSRSAALCTYLAGRFARAADRAEKRPRGPGRGAGKSGPIQIDTPGQEVLERTCIQVVPEYVEARIAVGLPAAGRRVLGRQAAEMLCQDLPAIARAALFYGPDHADAIDRCARTNEDADLLRDRLAAHGLVAFVAQDSVLPRASGVDQRPLSGAIPFQAPAPLRVELDLPNAGRVSGMGIPRGVTLIVGGGFHGKSTLLNALERGVYNHIPGDGRELVVTVPGAVKIRAEDGRRVAGVDISPFVSDLPYGRDTRAFTTDDASGSTSQAASIVEALEAGAEALLVDEDTAATNFMIRDLGMQQLVASENEPITPFVDRVRQLCDERGVSTILVMGGSSDYFHVADTVIAMESYVPHQVTDRARAIAASEPARRRSEASPSLGSPTSRIPLPWSIDPRRGRREESARSRGTRTLLFGEETIDLAAVEQLVDPSQTRALAAAMLYARQRYLDGHRTVAEVLDRVAADVAANGLDLLSAHPVGDHALFRRYELAAALNRLRTLEVRQVQ